MSTGRSIAADLKTELESQSWTNLAVNPKIKLGGRYGRIHGNYGVLTHEGAEDTEEYMTFAHSIVARDQTGTVEVWHKNEADRQKMIDDVEAILHSNISTYNWKVVDVKRETLKNSLYNAEIEVERLLS